MKRRRFISLAGQSTACLALPRLLRWSPEQVREAVVVGVDKASNLPVLHGAASGARAFDGWLRSEGFQTSLLSDERQRVTVNDVYTAIAERVRKGTIDQLVVYFAGHGYINSYSEFWMLSEAPDNPNEAVSLRESIELAKVCGIPNVVFISDACRSRADSLGVIGVRGALIFPNRTGAATKVGDVDVFLATLVGDSSFEVPVGVSSPQYQGIYTEAFLEAFRHPDPPMVATVQGVRVVPNRRLKGFLEREVTRRAAAVSVQLRQVPDTQVVSEDTFYIGRVGNAPPTPTDVPSAAVTVHDVAAADLSLLGIRGMSRIPDYVRPGRNPATAGPPPADVSRVKTQTGYGAATSVLSREVTLPELSDGTVLTGILVRGTAVREAVTTPASYLATLRPTSDGTLVLLETNSSRFPDPTRAQRSVAIQFADRGGTLIAAIRGFWAVVTVDNESVVDVTYIPARSNYRRGEYEADKERFNSLHASVAAAARFGVFRIEGGRSSRSQTAQALADRIRMMKAVDPTLGVYAAYAYSDAGLPNDVASVRGIMRGDLGFDLFDVAMLADALNGKDAVEPLVVPFCPMLSQGWNYLRIKNIRLSPVFETVRDHLRQGLWTTFTEAGISRVIASFRA